MLGPFPAGTYSRFGSTAAAVPFEIGARCEIRRAFTDFDGHDHPPGEAWTYLGSSFSPYDDGLSIFVSPDGTDEWQIRLCWRPDDQGPILNAFEEYIALA